MANGISKDKAKGAVVGAAGGVIGERNYKAEDCLRDACRAARKAGVGEGEIHKLVGAAIVKGTIDRFGAMPVAAKETAEDDQGIAGVLKNASQQDGLFVAGFASGCREEMAKVAAARAKKKKKPQPASSY